MTTWPLLLPTGNVTSWPREGVVLLILIAVLFALAAALANRATARGGAAPSPGAALADEQLDRIAPPTPDGTVTAGQEPTAQGAEPVRDPVDQPAQ